MVMKHKGMEIERIVFEDGTFKDYVALESLEGKTISSQEGQLKRANFMKEKNEYIYFSDIAGGFSFMLVETLKALHIDDRFTDIEKARIMFLGTYCGYEQKGRYLFTNNNRYILKADLQGLLEMTNKQEFYKFYNKLVATGIIEEEVINRYEIKLKWNSKYHFKGDTKSNGIKSTNAIKTYDMQIQALYQEKNAKGKSVNSPKNLYILFMVLPFINMKSGVLCHQQDNPVEDDCQPMTLEELAEMFGYSRTSMLKNKLLTCKLFSTNVFFIGEGLLDGKKYTRIYVNPFVANRSGYKNPNDTLLSMFPQTQKAIVQERKARKK